jgi:hypothetical protein
MIGPELTVMSGQAHYRVLVESGPMVEASLTIAAPALEWGGPRAKVCGALGSAAYDALVSCLEHIRSNNRLKSK